MRVAIASVILVSALAGTVAAADAGAILVGSWDLVSLESRSADGEVHKPFGETPRGRITYTADGRMSAQVMHSERPPFASGDLYGGSEAERAAAYAGYVAYYGSYRVDAAVGAVYHRIAGSLFPNWIGSEQERFYRLDGDRLILSTRPFSSQGEEVTAHVVWQRAR